MLDYVIEPCIFIKQGFKCHPGQETALTGRILCEELGVLHCWLQSLFAPLVTNFVKQILLLAVPISQQSARSPRH